MNSMHRRRFLQVSAGAVGAGWWGGHALVPLQAEDRKVRPKLPVAAIVTVYTNDSHADVLVGKILEGFEQDGGTGPDLRLAALYVDQYPKGDMSHALAKKHGFRLARTIEEAITVGTNDVAVAGVLSIGEHGSYPETPDTHQHMYPRRRFFDAIVKTFEKYNKVVPVYSDKHLSYAWKDAKHMVDTARRLKIPLMAGSSRPVCWRDPPLALPMGCAIEGALTLGYGGLEAYGFHALEGLQCMVERRKGGETGVVSVQAVRGDQIEKARQDGRWSGELLETAEAVIPPPSSGRPKEIIGPKSVVYLLEYRDGLRAATAMNTNAAMYFSFAARLKGDTKPVATWQRRQEGKPHGHFGYLLRGIEHMIHTGKPAYPVERTLLTTGVLDAVMRSLAGKGKLIETPYLDVRYQPADWPFPKGAPPEPKSA